MIHYTEAWSYPTNTLPFSCSPSEVCQGPFHPGRRHQPAAPQGPHQRARTVTTLTRSRRVRDPTHIDPYHRPSLTRRPKIRGRRDRYGADTPMRMQLCVLSASHRPPQPADYRVAECSEPGLFELRSAGSFCALERLVSFADERDGQSVQEVLLGTRISFGRTARRGEVERERGEQGVARRQ